MCRGCLTKDCKKKSRNELKAAAANPEDRSKYCCHHTKKACAISAANDVSLFLLHGETAERVFIYEDEYGESHEEREVYYTHPVRKFFQVGAAAVLAQRMLGLVQFG